MWHIGSVKKHSDFEHPTGEQRFRQVDQRISLPPYNTALWVLDRGVPIYSGDNYEWIERQCAPQAEASRQTLIRLRQRFRWSRPMMAAFLGVRAERFQHIGFGAVQGFVRAGQLPR